MHPDARFDRAAETRTTAERLLDRFTAYLRSRTADHWLMFLAGFVLGAVLA